MGGVVAAALRAVAAVDRLPMETDAKPQSVMRTVQRMILLLLAADEGNGNGNGGGSSSGTEGGGGSGPPPNGD